MMSDIVFEISEAELLNEKYSDQIFLNILKEKGAPVNGNFLLKVDSKYSSVESQYDVLRRIYIVTFKE